MRKAIIILVGILLTNLSFAKNSAFIKTTGQKQGQFKGESLSKGHEQAAEILSYSFEIISPRDASTGLPTGRRQYKPLTIIKDWGSSSNQYYTALATNENLKEVRIDFFVPATRDGGIEQLERSIVLTNANIADIKDVTTSVNGDLQDAEAISFIFQKITITDKSGTVFTDDWSTQN